MAHALPLAMALSSSPYTPAHACIFDSVQTPHPIWLSVEPWFCPTGSVSFAACGRHDFTELPGKAKAVRIGVCGKPNYDWRKVTAQTHLSLYQDVLMRSFVALGFIFALTGCADSHNWTPQQNGSARILASDRIFITTPMDGEYGTHAYTGFGRNTAKIIYNATSAKSRLVRIGGVTENFEDAVSQAQRADQDILIFPTILHWEDRATEWSMIPDKVEVKIDVVNVRTGDVISSGVIKGSSGLATLGGDHPQDLLPEPVGEFVSSLF